MEWVKIAEAFEDRWNFPNCLGAIDGKHITLRCPIKSGSYYFNYKGSFSIVLLALVDADYKFIFIDVGCNGRISDGGVFRNSPLSKALSSSRNPLGILESRDIEPGRKIPYVIVADDAFPLKEYIMKPYGLRNLTVHQRVFNYHLSRARRIVENAFGILASRFRIFLSPILLKPENAEKIVLASCALHNYLRTKSPNRYTPPQSLDRENDAHEFFEGEWRQEVTNSLKSLSLQCGNNSSNYSKEIRNSLCEYFNTTGKVPWVENYI